MSEIRANTVSNAAGTGPATLTKQSAAKAWAGSVTSSGVAGDSFNISSITDQGTGPNVYNFSSSFSNSSYSAAGAAGGESATLFNRIISVADKSSSSIRVGTFVADSGAASGVDQHITLNGDLA